MTEWLVCVWLASCAGCCSARSPPLHQEKEEKHILPGHIADEGKVHSWLQRDRPGPRWAGGVNENKPREDGQRTYEEAERNEVSKGPRVLLQSWQSRDLNRMEFLIYKIFLLYYLFHIILEALLFESEK